MDGHRSRVFSACFNPKSAHELISGGWDDTIQFWDTRQPQALRRISGVHMCGDGLDISSNGREVLASRIRGQCIRFVSSLSIFTRQAFKNVGIIWEKFDFDSETTLYTLRSKFCFLIISDIYCSNARDELLNDWLNIEFKCHLTSLSLC